MTCRRKQPRYYREKDWKPPYDLVIPPQYPAQYTLPPPGYNPTPGCHIAPGFSPASNYQYTQGYHTAWSYQPAPRHNYPWASNYQSFPSYQAVAAQPNPIPMLPAPSTVGPYAPTAYSQLGFHPFMACYGPSYYNPPGMNTFLPPRY
ncbi:hypothetical protein CHU98_g6214 [Xylaria longipes]|nr:hypothetical protein CHU98_g6214 [Xylaria longipes]